MRYGAKPRDVAKMMALMPLRTSGTTKPEVPTEGSIHKNDNGTFDVFMNGEWKRVVPLPKHGE